MTDVVIFGAGGQLGRELELTQLSACRAVYVTRAEVDIANVQQVTAYLDHTNPSTIINAAAYTAVDRAEEEPEQAEAANVAGPRNLAAWATGSDARLIHISTDFVFDGSAGEPYKPTDDPRPLGVYGKTKLEGERAVLSAAAGHIVLRTGWVYSRHGGNFVKTCSDSCRRESNCPLSRTRLAPRPGRGSWPVFAGRCGITPHAQGYTIGAIEAPVAGSILPSLFRRRRWLWGLSTSALTFCLFLQGSIQPPRPDLLTAYWIRPIPEPHLVTAVAPGVMHCGICSSI